MVEDTIPKYEELRAKRQRLLDERNARQEARANAAVERARDRERKAAKLRGARVDLIKQREREIKEAAAAEIEAIKQAAEEAVRRAKEGVTNRVTNPAIAQGGAEAPGEFAAVPTPAAPRQKRIHRFKKINFGADRSDEELLRIARERLADLVVEAGPDECWKFTGRRNIIRGKAWYGRMHLRLPGDSEPQTYGSHVVAWRIANGPIPSGLKVMHTICDNPACCNVKHMKLGTHEENMAEMVRKGRSTKGRPLLATQKLTDEQLIEIMTDPRSPRVLAPLYGISWEYCKGIKYGTAGRAIRVRAALEASRAKP